MRKPAGALTVLLAAALTLPAAAPAGASPAKPAGDAASSTSERAAVDLPPAAAPRSSAFSRRLAGDYVDPSRVYSTDVRWWLGKASHTDETLLEQVQALYDAGFRGVELCMQGDTAAPDADYAYGSKMWTHKWNLLMNKLLDLGMTVSLTSGTNWATSNVPGLDPTSQQAMQNLTLGTGTVAAGERLSVLPAPASTARKAGARFVTAYAYRVVSGNTVDPESRVDLAGAVRQGADVWSQELDWTAPSDGTYRVFGLWTQGTYQAASPATEPSYATNYFDERGVEALKEFWEKNYLADPALRAKIAAGDVHLFMDSLEINFGTGFTWWSEDMAAEFKKRKGYDITPYLFLISGVASSVTNPYHSVGATGTYRLDGEERRRQGIVNDYQDVLTELYRERMLQPLRTWLNSYGIETRVQGTYGKPLENSEAYMDADHPEIENLNQYNQVDIFRLHTGAAKLQNKVLSSETSAARLGDNYTPQRHLHDAYSSFASGIQRIVWHVWAADYGYGNYQWPAYNPGTFSVGWFHHFGLKHPGYADYDEFNAHLGRVQQFLATGKSRTDVGFVHQNWTQGLRAGAGVGSDNTQMNWQLAHQGVYYRSTELQDNGYTYDYFSPDFLFDDAVRFDERTKTIEQSGYQAVVLYQSWLDLEGAKRILAWAKKGLKVVVLEDAAARTPGNDGKDVALKKVVDELKTLPTVREATVYDNIDYFSSTPGGYDDNVLEKLQELGVEPYTGFEEPSLELLSQTRRDDDGNEFVYLYNYGDDEYHQYSHRPEIRKVTFDDTATSEIVKDGLFVPHEIDAWTGEVTELADYRYEDGKTILPVEVAQEDIALIAFEKVDAERLHVVDTDADSARAVEGGVAVRSTSSGAVTTELSNGTTRSDEVTVPEAYDITDWDLTVESWRPNATAGDLRRTETIDGLTTVNRKTSTVKTDIDVELDELTTWDKIPEVGKDVSGRGHYEATFDWDASAASGAYLDLGDRLEESMSVRINGVKVGGEVSTHPTKVKKDVGGVGKPTIDDGTGTQVPLVGTEQHTGGVNWIKPVADVSAYLRDGENTIEIDYNSALSNVQLSRGVNVPTKNVNGWWKNNFEYLSFGPQRAVLRPFVETAYTAESATRITAGTLATSYGTVGELAVRVDGDRPTGGLTLLREGTVIARGQVSADGTGTIRMAGTRLPVGWHRLEVRYAGDARNAASSAPASARIARATSTVSAAASPRRVSDQAQARINIRVSAPGVRPTGRVVVQLGGRTIATGTVKSNGRADLRLPRQRPGNLTLNVRYAGDANVAAGARTIRLEVVKRR